MSRVSPLGWSKYEGTRTDRHEAIIEPQRQKTYLRTCAPSEDSDQPDQNLLWAHFA